MKKNRICQVIPVARLKRDLHYFDYLVPEELASTLQRGHLVEIPFRNKKLKGVIFNFSNQPSKANIKLKSVGKILFPEPLLTVWQLALIKKMADYYFVSMAIIVKMFLPDVPKRLKDTQKAADDFYQSRQELPEIVLPQELNNNGRPILTRVYNEEIKFKLYQALMAQAVKTKKQIVFILPELKDIEKLNEYLEPFRKQTVIYLNNLKKSQAWQQWQLINKNQALIVIGTRSAIFAPFASLTTIVIDQEENENHKQEEPNPRYNVKDLAENLRALLKCRLLYFSSQPSLVSLFKVQQKNWDFYQADNLSELPEIKIIDRNEELKKGNYSIFSEELIAKIEYSLKRAQKVFLFLNRKGLASLASCRDCGYLAQCPQCKLPLTLHTDKKLICHHCNYSQNLFLFCPGCHGPNIKLTGSGTDKIEIELKKIFAQANIIKIDSDSPANIKNINNADIIIGTQYAFDYVDWSQIMLLGVLNADSLFYLPDYRGLEKTFSLLVNLINKISTKQKSIFIQTFTPQNYIFQAIKILDYKTYYLEEVRARKLLQYPPFAQLIRLIYQAGNYKSGLYEMETIYKQLKEALGVNKDIVISVPYSSHVPQVRGRWRWEILLKILNPQTELQFLNKIDENIIIDRDPEKLI